MMKVCPVAWNWCCRQTSCDRRLDGRALELDHLAALPAAQVLVLRVAVVVFVVHARPQLQAAQQAGVHELGQGPVDRGPADVEAGPFHVIDELVGVEMMVLAEDEPHHVALLVREALAHGRLARYSRNLSSGLCDTATAGNDMAPFSLATPLAFNQE